MQQFTPQGQQFIQDLAQRYHVSSDAVVNMVYAVMNGNGTMAQFSHPDLGGSGQWMMGGMTMVGDMFNYGLKSKVDGLCVEISNQLMNQPGSFQPAASQSQYQSSNQSSNHAPSGSLFVSAAAAGQWWPSDLGSPSSSGGQNNVRYAVFPATRRLAVELNGQTTIYDTLDHSIGGVSQQQGGNDSMTFNSQYGVVNVSSLPVISLNGFSPQPPAAQFQPPQFIEALAEVPSFAPPAAFDGDVFAKIERLADLFQKGVLTEREFTTKKAELLNQV